VQPLPGELQRDDPEDRPSEPAVLADLDDGAGDEQAVEHPGQPGHEAHLGVEGEDAEARSESGRGEGQEPRGRGRATPEREPDERERDDERSKPREDEGARASARQRRFRYASRSSYRPPVLEKVA
jgi:hypothetical protein